jgi:hypothetical protein
VRSGRFENGRVALIARYDAVELLKVLGLGHWNCKFLYLKGTRVTNGACRGFRLAVITAEAVLDVCRRRQFIYDIAVWHPEIGTRESMRGPKLLNVWVTIPTSSMVVRSTPRRNITIR